MTTNTIRRGEWPHGVFCTDCGHEFVEGEAYHHRLDSLTEDGIPVVEVVCGGCIFEVAK